MSAKELTREQQELSDLGKEVNRLRGTLEALLIKNAGITELEGDYIEVYEDADRLIARRTGWAIDAKVRQKELNRLEAKISEMQHEANQLRQDVRSELSENPYIQFAPGTFPTGVTGIGMPLSPTTTTVSKEYYVK